MYLKILHVKILCSMIRLGLKAINIKSHGTDVKAVSLSRTLPRYSLCQNGLSNGIKHLKKIGMSNVQDLLTVMYHNNNNGYKVVVVPTCLFPFAADPYYGYSLKYVQRELEIIGKYARENQMRLTWHMPNSLSRYLLEDVYHERMILDRMLNHCLEMIEYMKLNDGLIIVSLSDCTLWNVDKKSILKRLRDTLRNMDTKQLQKLALENDPYNFGIDELDKICEEFSIPLVMNTQNHLIRCGKTLNKEKIKELGCKHKQQNLRQLIIHSEPENAYTYTMEEKLRISQYAYVPEELTKDSSVDIDIIMLYCQEGGGTKTSGILDELP